MPLGARPRSIQNVNKYCSEIYVPYTLDDIFDEGSKFQNRMFISFPQFAYCSSDEVYFPKLSCLLAAHGGTPGGGGTPYVMGDTYVPRFWPPFFTLAGSSTIFLGYFSHPPTAKLSFGVQKLPIFYKNRSFWPQIQFFPRSFWVQFSAASGTPPSVFRPSTPPGGGTLHSKWAPYNGCYASHSWRHKATCDVTAALWCHMVRGCLGDVSNEDLAIIENNQFTNLIE